MDPPKYYSEMMFWKFFLPGGRVHIATLFFILAYTAFVIYWDDHLFPAKKLSELGTVLYTSAAMGLLMVFRTNSAYDRWWEARKLWGQLVNEIRNFSLKLKFLLPDDDPRRKLIAHSLIQFPQVLCNHLREELRSEPPIDKGVAEIGSFRHIPLQYAQSVYQCLIEIKKEGTIDGFEFLHLDPHARSLMDICGSCERILRSPIAGSYKLMIWVGIFI
ncbi:MAG: hypothetical protein K2X81_27765, partial [Candidatus Obscuribacterales bacterium]|nr:hypothetical protein [Candidatus Obscuribacterales bacterium]